MRTAPHVAALSLSIAGLLAAGGHAAAQFQGGGGPNPTPPTDFDWEATIPVPDTVAAMDTILRMRAGDPDGDLRPDVFVRGAPAPSGSSGSHEIVFVYSPWSGSAVAKLAQTANDFDVQPATALTSSTNLATVGSGGLELVSWNPAQTPPFSAALVTADAAWLGASFVRCAELDGATGGDYIGVGSDRRTVLLRSGGGTVSFQAPADVVAIEALQWITGGAHEIAVLTANGLRVHYADGTVADDYPFGAPKESAFTVVRFGAAGPDRIAWAVAGATGQPWSLDTVRRAAPQHDPIFALPYSDVVALSAGDMDADGDVDLAVAHRSSREVRVYSNGITDGYVRVYAPQRSQTETDPVLVSLGSTSNAVAPIFADLGNDRRADLFFAMQIEMVLNGQTLNFTRFEVLKSVPESAFSSEVAFGDNTRFEFTPTGNEAVVRFLIDSGDFNGLATHVQVLPWTQTNAQSYLTPQSDGPIRLFPIDPAQLQSLSPTWGVELTLPLAGGDQCAMPIRWLEVRLVQLDPATQVLIRAWQTYTCALITHHADFCALWHENNLHFPIVIPEPAPSEESESIACAPPVLQCIGSERLGNWPAEAITRRRKADPPPGIVPVVPVEPLQMPVIPCWF